MRSVNFWFVLIYHKINFSFFLLTSLLFYSCSEEKFSLDISLTSKGKSENVDCPELWLLDTREKKLNVYKQNFDYLMIDSLSPGVYFIFTDNIFGERFWKKINIKSNTNITIPLDSCVTVKNIWQLENFLKKENDSIIITLQHFDTYIPCLSFCLKRKQGAYEGGLMSKNKVIFTRLLSDEDKKRIDLLMEKLYKIYFSPKGNCENYNTYRVISKLDTLEFKDERCIWHGFSEFETIIVGKKDSNRR